MTPEPQPPAVVVATPTILSGLVVRWRAVVNGDALLSASRARVMIHGDVDLARIEPWLDDARRAHEALRAGRDGDARALATHRYARLLGALVPIGRSEERELSEAFTGPVPVPAGELPASGLAMEEAQEVIAGLRGQLGAARETIAAEIEAEAATHLYFIRRAMHWAAWTARGKPPESDPASDRELSGALLHGDAERTGVPCCPVETAAIAAERERIREAAGGLKFTVWRGGTGQEQPLDVVPLAGLLRLLEGA